MNINQSIQVHFKLTVLASINQGAHLTISYGYGEAQLFWNQVQKNTALEQIFILITMTCNSRSSRCITRRSTPIEIYTTIWHWTRFAASAACPQSGLLSQRTKSVDGRHSPARHRSTHGQTAQTSDWWMTNKFDALRGESQLPGWSCCTPELDPNAICRLMSAGLLNPSLTSEYIVTMHRPGKMIFWNSNRQFVKQDSKLWNQSKIIRKPPDYLKCASKFKKSTSISID